MMKKNRLRTLYCRSFLCASFLLCLLLPDIASAQSQKSKTDTLTRYKWEIATDLLWLIDKNSAPSYSVFARKNITTKNGNQRAWRLRVGANYNWFDQLSSDTSDHYKNWTYEVLLRPGYEWQKTFKQLQVNYGLDAHFRWLRMDYVNLIDLPLPNGVDQYSTEYQQTWEWGLVGFVGVKYFVTPRISLSMETNFGASYQRFDQLSESFYISNDGVISGQRIGSGKTDRKSINFGFNPMYILQISYLFN